MLREVGIVRNGAKILIADELDLLNQRQQDKQAEDEEVLEDIQVRIKKDIDDIIYAELVELAAEEARELMKAARILAEQTTYSLKAVMEATMNALNGPVNPKRARRGWGFTTAWDRKEAREKRQAVEQETASRFQQYKVRELSWKQRQGKRPHWREWRGPDRT